MTDGSSDGVEQEILRVSVADDGRYLGAAEAALDGVLRANRIDESTVSQVHAVTDELCREILAQRPDADHAIPLQLALLDVTDGLLMRVDDLGPPWHAGSFDTSADSPLGKALGDCPAAAFHIMHLGREGNRAELLLRQAKSEDDVRGQLTLEDHEDRLAAPAVDADAPVEIRKVEARDAVGIARLVHHCYGYSYDADWVYQPERIARMIESGILHSFVGVTPDGDVVGHLGMIRPEEDSRVGESGQAVVDPRYRGHHLLKTMKTSLAAWARDFGLSGLFSEATAAHPYSQRANIQLGAHETGILLGYIPNTVRYRSLHTTAEGNRRSVVLYYLKTNEAGRRSVHVPLRYREIVELIFSEGELNGDIRTEGRSVTLAETTALDVELRRDHNQAIITVGRYGEDFVAAMTARLRQLCLHKVDCIYADLPLIDPATSALGGDLAELGFLFGGIFPNRRSKGDVLRLQYLNNVEIAADDVTVSSDLGRALLDFILAAES